MTDHKSAMEWANEVLDEKPGPTTENLAACYIEQAARLEEVERGAEHVESVWKAAEAKLATIRRETVEECAKVCEEARLLVAEDQPLAVARESAQMLAQQIRALANDQPQPVEFARRLRAEQGKQEPVAYLYTGRDTNKVNRQWASVSNSDHWPVDQWETIRQELLYLAAPTPDALLAAELRGMERAIAECYNWYNVTDVIIALRAETNRREGK